VRRRGLPKKLERNTSIGESSPALLRRTTIADGEACLFLRNSVNSVGELVRRKLLEQDNSSASAGKIPLRRGKTVEDATSSQKASEDKQPSQRSSVKTKEDMYLAKVEALRALVASMDAGTTLAEILHQLTRHVLKHQGTSAFTAEHVARAHMFVLEAAKEKGMDFERTDAVMMALTKLSEEVDMDLSDILGQILWRNRRAESLREKQRRRETVEDVSWAAAGTDDPDVSSDVLKSLDDVFDMFEAGQKGRGLSVKAWQRVAKFVQANPVLRRRVNLTDVDRLWYAATHKPGMEVQVSIGRRAFKELLLTWCEAMNVHPWMVFVAVGSHANDWECSESWQKIVR
jgi:hypothetical protein